MDDLYLKHLEQKLSNIQAQLDEVKKVLHVAQTESVRARGDEGIIAPEPPSHTVLPEKIKSDVPAAEVVSPPGPPHVYAQKAIDSKGTFMEGVGRFAGSLSAKKSISVKEPEIKDSNGVGKIAPDLPPAIPPREKQARSQWFEEAFQILEKLGMIPSKGGDSLEVQLGTWWATRIGALLFVIAAVFFGIYISRDSTVLRFMSLLGSSLGVTFLGAWIERKVKNFGAVLFGAGLAMLHFSAFAAYALDSVQVTQSAQISFWMQLLAVGIIIYFGLKRESRVLATMAVFLGFVACFFSTFTDLPILALLMAFLLSATGAAFFVVRGWAVPLLLSTVLIFLLYFMVHITCFALRADESSFQFRFFIAYLMVVFSLFIGTDFLAHSRGVTLPARAKKVFVLFVSSATIVAGVWTVELFSASYWGFLFLMGAVLLALSQLYKRVQNEEGISNTFYAKSMTLIAFGFIDVFDAHKRWIALFVQSGVILRHFIRTRSLISEVIHVVLWLVSLAYFAGELPSVRAVNPLFSLTGFLALAFLFASSYVHAAYEQISFPLSQSRDWAGLKSLFLSEKIKGQAVISLFFSLLLGTVSIRAMLAFSGLTDEIVKVSLLAFFFLALAGAIRHPLPAVVGLFPLFYSFTLFHHHLSFGKTDAILPNFLVMEAVAIAAAVGIWRLTRNNLPAAREHRGAIQFVAFLEGTLHFCWIASLYRFLGEYVGSSLMPFIAVVLAAVLTLFARKWPFHTLGDFAVLPLALAVIFPRMGLFHESETIQSSTFLFKYLSEWLFTLGGVAAIVFLCGVKILEKKRGERPCFFSAGMSESVRAILSTVLAADMFLLVVDNPANSMPVAALAGVGCFFLYARLGITVMSRLVFLFTWIVFYRFMQLHPVSGWGNSRGYVEVSVLLKVIVSSLTLLATYVLMRRWKIPFQARSIPLLSVLFAGSGLIFLFIEFWLVVPELRHYTTVFWGLSAITWVAVGLAMRTKMVRLMGLIGLVCCIVRVFMVDATSTLYRIYAFGVLGVVLLVIGYLYSRLRDNIRKWDEAGE